MAPSNTQAATTNSNHNKPNTRCPACGYRGYPIIVSTASPSAVTIFLIVALCLSCACCFLGNVRVSTLAFYCEHCGLRFVTEDHASSQVQYDGRNLIPWPSETEKPPLVRQVSDLKVASSPLGLPEPIRRPYLIDIKARYRHLKPVQILNLETGDFKLPCKATKAAQPAVTYIIEAPGIPPVDPTAKKEPQYLQRSCAWSFSSHFSHHAPHFRVSRQNEDSSMQEIAQVQLFGGANWKAEIHVVNRIEAKSESGPNKVGGQQSYITQQMLAAEEYNWRNIKQGILWNSSQGLLLWSERKIEDGDNAKGVMLCLLDAYDRLVLALQKIRHPEGQGKIWQMRFYVDAAESFLGEILASYTALLCQQERILQEHMFDSS